MADCFSAPGLMPFEQAKDTLLQSVPIITEREVVNIEHADKRILGSAVHSE